MAFLLVGSSPIAGILVWYGAADGGAAVRHLAEQRKMTCWREEEPCPLRSLRCLSVSHSSSILLIRRRIPPPSDFPWPGLSRSSIPTPRPDDRPRSKRDKARSTARRLPGIVLPTAACTSRAVREQRRQARCRHRRDSRRRRTSRWRSPMTWDGRYWRGRCATPVGTVRLMRGRVGSGAARPWLDDDVARRCCLFLVFVLFGFWCLPGLNNEGRLQLMRQSPCPGTTIP